MVARLKRAKASDQEGVSLRTTAKMYGVNRKNFQKHRHHRVFPAAICGPYESAFCAENLRNGFRYDCLYPLDRVNALAKVEKYRPLQHSINVPDNSQREMITTDLIEKDDDEQEKLRQEQCGLQDEDEPTQKIIRQNLSRCAVLTGCVMIDLMRQSLFVGHSVAREEDS